MIQDDDSAQKEEGRFPWHLGIYDAHCHPTDEIASIDKIPRMRTRALAIMATREQDQELTACFAEKLGSRPDHEDERYLIPAFGWHPWFSHQIYDDSSSGLIATFSKDSHYKQIITPLPADEKFIASLPEPRSLSSLLQKMRTNLEKYPTALVGEIGLDRAFRIPGLEMLDQHEANPALTPGGRGGRRLSPYRVDMKHQQRVLTAQLNLAGEMQRAVSVHGVAAHGLLHATLTQTWHGHERPLPSKREKSPRTNITGIHDGDDRCKLAEHFSSTLAPNAYPPRICLHSFSGHLDTLRLYLHPSIPAIIFFSFSRLVNFNSPYDKAFDVIKAVPDDKILAESDFHSAGDEMDGLIEDIVRTICHIKGWSLEQGVKQLALNWKHFIFGKASS